MHPLVIQKEKLEKEIFLGVKLTSGWCKKETFDLTEVRCWQSPLGQDSEEDQHHLPPKVETSESERRKKKESV